MKLYNKYCDGMYYVALRFLKNTHDAEEAMQEGFIQAFLKLHQFTGEVTFGAWLKRIVINKSIDMLGEDDNVENSSAQMKDLETRIEELEAKFESWNAKN